MFQSIGRISAIRRVGRAALQKRCYLGQAGEGTQTLSKREEELLKVAVPRAEAIFAEHTRMPPVPTAEDAVEVRRKRLIYRSKQRGWLEVDLLLGTWAHQNVPQLSAEQLDEYENFVNCETIDIYNIITLKVEVPEELKGTIVDQIQSWARANPLGKADPAKYKEVKLDNQLT